jgi:hypothetical protein
MDTTIFGAGSRSIIVAQVISLLLFVFVGCGNTKSQRQSVLSQLNKLRDTIKANPGSDEAGHAMKELVETLEGNWRFAQIKACDAIGELGPLGASAVPNLMQAVEKNEPFVAQEAIHALARIGPDAAPALKLFIDEVKMARLDIPPGLGVLYAVDGLGNIGPPAREAIPTLERALTSTDAGLVHRTRQALRKIDPIGKYGVE